MALSKFTMLCFEQHFCCLSNVYSVHVKSLLTCCFILRHYHGHQVAQRGATSSRTDGVVSNTSVTYLPLENEAISQVHDKYSMNACIYCVCMHYLYVN